MRWGKIKDSFHVAFETFVQQGFNGLSADHLGNWWLEYGTKTSSGETSRSMSYHGEIWSTKYAGRTVTKLFRRGFYFYHLS